MLNTRASQVLSVFLLFSVGSLETGPLMAETGEGRRGRPTGVATSAPSSDRPSIDQRRAAWRRLSTA
jgi:hypothetical protein